MLSASPDEEIQIATFVNRLKRLGPTATKVSQYLALRPDLLPEPYCNVLLRLVDRVPPVAWPDLRRVVIDEFGREPEAIFAQFEQRPIAAGAIAQVHRAVLDDGTQVAVKIQRPGIAPEIAKNTRRLRLIARLAARSSVTQPISPRELADDLANWLLRETDFISELANIQQLRRLGGGSALQHIPRTFADLCTQRVLTYEYSPGISLSEILQGLRTQGGNRLGRSLLADVQPRRVAENLVLACLTHMLRYGYFPVDLHPDNLNVLPDDVIGFANFGLCERLDETVRANQRRYMAAVYDRDHSRMFNALAEILVPGESANFEQLRRDFMAETRSLEGKGHLGNGPGTPTSTASYLIGIMRATRRNDFQVPFRVLSLYRALVTIETVAAKLGLADGLREVGQKFIADLQRQELVGAFLEREQIEKVFANALTLIREGPAQVGQIMADLAEGSLRLKVEVTESTSVAQAQNRRARLWTCAVLSVGVAVLLTVPQLPTLYGISLGWPLAGVLAGLYAVCFILWRRL